jgi:hypothetical protein
MTGGVPRRTLRAAGVAGLALLIAGMTAWAALAIYYSELPAEPLPLGLARGLLPGHSGGVPVPAEPAPDAGRLWRCVRRRAAVVDLDRSVQPARLADRRRSASLRHARRRPRDFAQRPQLRLPDRAGFRAALRRPHLRSAPTGRGRPDRGLLGGRCDRAHHGELRLRRRSRRVLDRDPPGEGRGLLLGRRLLQALRADLRGRRRARPDPGAPTTGDRKSRFISTGRARNPRTPGACSWNMSPRSTS